jgi:apolipoprotein N-acyltransferase
MGGAIIIVLFQGCISIFNSPFILLSYITLNQADSKGISRNSSPIRGEWVLGGFPWLQVAYSQLDTPLSGYIPVMGVYGAGLVVTIISATMAEAFLNKKYRYQQQ